MKNTTLVGNMAEDLSAQYLTDNGYTIVGRNIRNRYSEIDIIAHNDDYICLVEVKYRKNSHYGGGLEAITANKKRRLRNSFQYWLGESDKYDLLQPRIDVIAIDQQGAIEHIQNAV